MLKCRKRLLVDHFDTDIWNVTIFFYFSYKRKKITTFILMIYTWRMQVDLVNSFKYKPIIMNFQCCDETTIDHHLFIARWSLRQVQFSVQSGFIPRKQRTQCHRATVNINGIAQQWRPAHRMGFYCLQWLVIGMTSSNETFSALLALCAGNSPVNGEFPSEWPVARSGVLMFLWSTSEYTLE